MTLSDFAGAHWIARPVPADSRISRETRRDRIDWAEPGRPLGQSFIADAEVTAISIDITGPPTDPFDADVKFTVAVTSGEGDVIAYREVEGAQHIWERFGMILDVTPAAPAGEYTVTLTSERCAIGWWTADAASEGVEDDGVSPRPVRGLALRQAQQVPGIRTIAIETVPAPNPVFSTSFVLDDLAATATLRAVALGCGVVSINGRRVGDEMLEPAVTDYDKTILYRERDVAALLRVGVNEILIEAGRDRFAARGGDTWGWHLAPWHREPVTIARLDGVDVQGQPFRVTTGAGWRTRPGAVEHDRLYRGEDWVIRADEPEWESATVVSPPRGSLRSTSHPPVIAGAPRPPVSVESRADGSVVYDFGVVMTGRIRCTVTGSAGATVSVVSGEQRSEEGEVVCDNVLVAGPAQVDSVRLERDVVRLEWEPQFGYRGFRWMQVHVDGAAEVGSVRAVPLHTPLDVVGSLTTGEPLFEWIDTATAETFRNNMHGVPTDTPIYEKNGWTADAHLATEALLHHFDLRSSFEKWLDDHADAQSADGAIPQIIPTPGWGRPTDPAWSISAVLIPWYLYREHGDASILRRREAMMRGLADNVISQLDAGLWPARSWGDWLAPGHEYAPEGMTPVGTIMSVQLLQHVAACLREIHADGWERYEQAGAGVAAAYHERYFDADAGCYRIDGLGYRQSMNVLPLAFRATPPEHVASVRASLIDDLENRTAGHLDVGAVGVRHLLPVLSDAGRDDLAITVLSRRTRPSWGYWFDQGESTLLESWEASARSRNHYFLGSVSAWIQQRIGGLRAAQPGWRHIEIAPVDDDRVTSASIRHRTPNGEAAVRWERGPGGWTFDIVIPDESTATIKVRGEERDLDADVMPARIARQVVPDPGR